MSAEEDRKLRAQHTCVKDMSSLGCRACNRGVPYPHATTEELVADMKAQIAAKEEAGSAMACPECGVRNAKVLETRQLRAGLRRRRRCVGCQIKFTTVEVTVPEGKVYADAKVVILPMATIKALKEALHSIELQLVELPNDQ